ncbi:voltage-dependent anion-selective channel-like [Brevipalpus obovatus]|uniref:voltage-dependent anion-selective channel-like n=1 Tax=Brevipalpus obovatus TaxID=246614 RepID=UPI003D9F1392
MAPPSYNELGSQARALFSKHYHLGQIKLDVITKTPTGLEFTCAGLSNRETGRVLGHLESKHNVKEWGLTFKEKWTTDNQISTEITVADKMMEGLKLGAVGSFTPQAGKKRGTVSASMKGGYFNVGSEVELDQNGPLINATGVVGSRGFLVGAQCSFDPNQKKFTKTNVSLAYLAEDFQLHTNINQKTDFSGSVYQKVNDSLQSGVSFGWSSKSNETQLAVGCIYKIDDSSSWKAKISNNSQICLGFVHKLRPGILVALSSMVDAKNLNDGGHKLGLGIELNAS